MPGTNHLLATLQATRAAGRIALCGYFLAGYPNPEAFYRVVRAAQALDVIEYGIPADNPTMDGAVISEAHAIVTEQRGIGAETALALIGGLRDLRVPRFVMTYSRVGRELDGFLRLCMMNGLHGMLAPDMDEEELRFLATIMRTLDLAVVTLVDARADDAVLERQVRLGDVVYLKASPGPTGTAAEIDGTLHTLIESTIQRVRALRPHMPIAVGIGIQRPDQVTALAKLGVDMAVIGTKLVERAAEGEQAVAEYVMAMREAGRR